MHYVIGHGKFGGFGGKKGQLKDKATEECVEGN